MSKQFLFKERNNVNHFNYYFYNKAFTPQELIDIKELGNEFPMKPAEVGGEESQVTDYRVSEISWIIETEKTQWLYDKIAKYADEELFSRIDEITVLDGSNIVIEGYEFAPSFSIWTTIEECLNPPLIWEDGRGWYTTAPFSEIVKMHLSVCNVEKFVNIIVCDAKHSHHFYKDETIKMFYIDGINNQNDLLDIFISIPVSYN